jgi:uncharacterized protein with GYD domain
MPRFIVTGTYTQAAAAGMLDHPSDRAAAAKKAVKGAGGKLEGFYVTTGPTDFLVIVEIDDVTDLLAAFMAVSASGAVGNIQTQRAFSGEEFMAMQKRASELKGAYTPPN